MALTCSWFVGAIRNPFVHGLPEISELMAAGAIFTASLLLVPPTSIFRLPSDFARLERPLVSSSGARAAPVYIPSLLRFASLG